LSIVFNQLAPEWKKNTVEIKPIITEETKLFWVEEMTNLGRLTIRYDPEKVSASSLEVHKLSEFVDMTVETQLEGDETEASFNKSDYDFNFEPVEFDKSAGRVVFQLEFVNPLKISSGKEQDKMRISFDT